MIFSRRSRGLPQSLNPFRCKKLRRKRAGATRRVSQSSQSVGAQAVERLEARLALAVDVAFQSPASATADNWIVILADARQTPETLQTWNIASDVGSDIFMEVVATPTEDLFVADNASFLNRQEIPSINSVTDEIFVYSGTNVRRDAFVVDVSNGLGTAFQRTSAFFGVPNLESRSNGAGYTQLHGSGGYPWWNGQTNILSFVIPAEGIDFTEVFEGEIILQNSLNTVIRFTNDPDVPGDAFGDNDGFFGVGERELGVGPTKQRTLTIDGVAANGGAQTLQLGVGIVGGGDTGQLRLEFDFTGFAMPADVGVLGVPVLNVETVDVDTEPEGLTPNKTIVNTMVGLGAAVTAAPNIQVFDPAEHQYVPGTLRGTLVNEYGVASVSTLSFQVDESGTGRGIPLSFGADRSLTGDLGTFTYYNDDGTTSTEALEVTGTFDSISGEIFLSVTLEGQSVARPYSPFIEQVKLGVRDIGAANTPDPMLPVTATFAQVRAAGGNTGTQPDSAANDFTLFPGHDLTRGLVIELANLDSSISIESPVVATTVGSNTISLAASRIDLNAPVRAAAAFRIPTADLASNSSNQSAFGTITEAVTVNSLLSSPSFDIRMQSQRSVLDSPLGTDAPTNIDGSLARGRLVVTQTGSISNVGDVLTPPGSSLTSANQIYVEMIDGDIFVEGRVVAALQSYLIQSPEMQDEGDNAQGGWSELTSYPEWSPYTLTTASRVTGVDVGVIEAATLAVTLANDTLILPVPQPDETFESSRAFSVLDVTTDVGRLRVQASDRKNDSLQVPFPYKVNVRERTGLIVDAVAASSETIDISVNGTLDFLAKLESAGDIRLESTEAFTLGAPLSTRFGLIEMTAPSVTVRNSVRVLDGIQDERDTDVRITATAGDLVLDDAVGGINRVVLNQQGDGNIAGNARVFADVFEVNGTGDVRVRSAATRIAVRAPGEVFVEELDYGVFEIRDARDVTLIANGFDQIVTEEQVFTDDAVPPEDRAYVSPALFADVYDTQVLTVSAPNGSVDVYHYGSSPLSVGSLTRITEGTEVDMAAAGSVSIRSTLSEITVYDAPTPTGDARQVRLATTEKLTFVADPPGVNGGSRGYFNNSPGIVAPRLNRVKITRVNAAGAELVNGGVPGDPIVDPAFKFGRELGNVDVTTLRVGDRILVKDGAALDPDDVGTDDLGVSNGIYTILRVYYPVGDTRFVELDLVRADDADTTAELAQKHYVRVAEGPHADKVFTADGSVRRNFDANGDNDFGDPGDLPNYAAYVGWGAANSLRFANVFDNDVADSPVQIRPIVSRTGYVSAAAVTTGVLSAAGATYDAATEVINFDVAIDALPGGIFNNVNLVEGDLVLVRYGAIDDNTGSVPNTSPGLYQVVNNAGKARFTRYQGVDENGDGLLDRFYTGRVAIDQGSLRTAITGEMFEISLASLGFVPLRYQEVTSYSLDDVEAGRAFDSVKNYRADIGSNNPVADVTYVVSTENAINTNAVWAGGEKATGSFGRMLTLLQQNTAINERTGDPQEQSLTFSEAVSRIDLLQALPVIQRPIDITGNGSVTIDGTGITRDANGGVVRSGSVSTSVGPVRPSQTSTSRRIYRPGQKVAGGVYGLEIVAGAAGTTISGLALGGFNNGAAVRVAAENVVLRNMTIGRDATSGRLANRDGIQIDGGASHSTVTTSTIVNSTNVGLSLGVGAGPVRVVGNTIGATGEGNKIGVLVDQADGTGSYIGSASVPATTAITTVAGTAVDVDAAGDPDADPVDPPVLNTPNDIRIRIPDSAAARQMRVGMFLYDAGNDIAREIQGIGFEPGEGNAAGVFVVQVDFDAVDGQEVPGSLYRLEDNGQGVVENVVINASSVSYQVGHLLTSIGGPDSQDGQITLGDTEVLIPIGVNPRDVYLGQTVRSNQPGIPTGTEISSLRVVNDPGDPNNNIPEGPLHGRTIATLSESIDATGTAILLLGTPLRNLVTANSDGIVLRGANSSVVNTIVSASVYDGIRVEETRAAGKHVIGDALGQIPGFPHVGVLSTSNVQVFGNQLSGIRLTEKAFAALGNLDEAAVPAADYGVIDTYLRDNLRIIGNYIGYDPASGNAVGNGQTGIANVVVDLEQGDDKFANLERIRFLLLEDDTVNDNGTADTVADDFFEARLRPNVGTGLDSQRNRYGESTDGPPTATDPDRTITPPRRPFIR